MFSGCAPIVFCVQETDYVVFHDVDMLPMGVDYSYPGEDSFAHLASEASQFDFQVGLAAGCNVCEVFFLASLEGTGIKAQRKNGKGQLVILGPLPTPALVEHPCLPL
jgi:hypothetical protein